MIMYKRFLLSILPCMISFCISAQLSDMAVVGIEVCGIDQNAPVNRLNKKPWALFRFEIENIGGRVVNGSPITLIPESTNNTVSPYDDDKVNHGYAAAWSGRRTKSITLHHPDFYNCKVVLADFIGNRPLEGGNVYKIKLRLPSQKVLEANSAYNEMDFEKAAKLYSHVATDIKEDEVNRIVANEHLEDIDTLASYKRRGDSYLADANSLDAMVRRRALWRARFMYEGIFKRTGNVKAGLIVDSIRTLLDDSAIKKSFVNTFRLDSAAKSESDMRAFGNDAVHFSYLNKKRKTADGKSALLIITLPVHDARVESDIEIKRKVVNDALWLYVKPFYDDELIVNDKTEKKLNDADKVLFSLGSPGYEPIYIKLGDIEGTELLEPETVYVIDLSTLSPIMATADRLLATLDLESARSFYKYNFEDAAEQEHAEKSLAFIESENTNALYSQIKETFSR